MVTILTEDLEGEYLDEDRSRFMASMEAGPTIVIGHVDYSLGATAKSWQAAIPSPPEGESTLESERHAEPAAGAPPWARGAELGWSCAEFAWILQPPLNGTTDEALGFVGEILGAGDC